MSGWDEVIAAVGRAQQGMPGGHEALLEQWAAMSGDEHAQRCVLAHYLADGEPELADEVAWDEVALREHALLADDAFVAIGIPSARAMAPSLHLNLGDGYLRQGRVEQARVQLDAGLAAVDTLGNDGYGAVVRGGLERFAGRLASVTDPDLRPGSFAALTSQVSEPTSSVGDAEADPHRGADPHDRGELDASALRQDERPDDG